MLDGRAWRATAALALSLAGLVGCAGTGPTASPRVTGAASATAGEGPSGPMPTASVTASPPRVDIATLPDATLDPTILTAVCDPVPSQSDSTAGESTIGCGEGVFLGLRALSTVAAGSIDRIYLRRPDCPAAPCSDDVLNTAFVVGWSGTAAFGVELDRRLATVTAPVADPTATWPISSGSAAPATNRPAIDGAPPEVANRTALPDCGHASVGDPPAVLGCFRDAVLGGRPAEMTEQVFGTEGGEGLWLFRFTGRGAVVRYATDPSATGAAGPWQRQDGAMILGISNALWDFDPWAGGVAVAS